MKYLVYISTAKKLFNEGELVDLLLAARKKNETCHITGMLIYSQGTFIQVLEGEEADVNLIYLAIEHDIRHKNIIKMVTGDIEKRIFPDWSMAFASVHDEILQEIEGYLSPANRHFLGDEGHATVMMLKTFAETNKISVSF